MRPIHIFFNFAKAIRKLACLYTCFVSVANLNLTWNCFCFDLFNKKNSGYKSTFSRKYQMENMDLSHGDQFFLNLTPPSPLSKRGWLHLWTTQTDMTIVAGSDDPTNTPAHRSKRKFIQRRKIKEVKLHPLFDSPAAKFDLALVEIVGQFTFRDSRSPICIPSEVRCQIFSSLPTYLQKL